MWVDFDQYGKLVARRLRKSATPEGYEQMLANSPDVKEQLSPEPINMDRVKASAEYFKKKIDEDIEEDVKALKIKDMHVKLTNDEKIQVLTYLKDKAPESNKMYSTLLKEYLKQEQ